MSAALANTPTVAEPIYFLLCAECAGAIIEPHPRLYRQLPPHAPAPGTMPICWNCRFRAGSGCQHAQSRARGGRGLRLDMPSPTWGHMRTRRDPETGSRSKTFVLYHGPVWGCDGKKL